MAELLVMLTDPARVTDPAWQYMRGDVIVIQPDGHPWGADERPPRFCVLRVPGDPGEYSHLMAPLADPIAPGEDLAVRRLRLDLDLVPGLADPDAAPAVLEIGAEELRALEQVR